MKTGIGIFFFIVALIFVYRSFYAMRIPEENTAPEERPTIPNNVPRAEPVIAASAGGRLALIRCSRRNSSRQGLPAISRQTLLLLGALTQSGPRPAPLTLIARLIAHLIAHLIELRVSGVKLN